MSTKLRLRLSYLGMGLCAALWMITAMGVLPPVCAPVGFGWLLLLFVTVFIVHLFGHELGHLLAFRHGGIAIRAYYVGPFLFLREENGFRLRLRWNALTAIGGIVVPDLRPIADEADFKAKQTAFADAIGAGPYATGTLGALIAVAALVACLCGGAELKTIGLSVCLADALLVLTIRASSRIETDFALGDFPAEQRCRHDEFFFACQYYQYGVLALDCDAVRRDNTWLRAWLCAALAEKQQAAARDFITIGAVETLTTEYLTGLIDECPAVVRRYNEELAAEPRALLRLGHEPAILLYHRLILFFVHEGERERAQALFDVLALPSEKQRVQLYLYRQAATALGVADHRAFLAESKNVWTSTSAAILRIFAGYHRDEARLNACCDHCSEGSERDETGLSR